MSAARSTSSASRFTKTASARRAAQPQAAPEEASARPERGHTAVRSKPLRTTVDLSPADHRRLRQIADRLAEDLDEVEVPRRAVWLALLAELDADEALYERVLARIKADRMP
ncbi:hypothetical protein [Nocardiopsis dassonvillei]|uniref:hypothetical protein n=1 Tax=Nocardiopsis dassonvillei TaxID=2014 RepID=UPI003F54AC27